MADNYTATPGAGLNFRAIELDSVKYPVVMQDFATTLGWSTSLSIDMDSTGQIIKASPGVVKGWYFYNRHATDEIIIKLYDQVGLANPASDVPKLVIPLPALGGSCPPFGPIVFTSGIVWRATKDIGNTGTTAPGANKCIANLIWK